VGLRRRTPQGVSEAAGIRPSSAVVPYGVAIAAAALIVMVPQSFS
jgi:hypothetical protein